MTLREEENCAPNPGLGKLFDPRIARMTRKRGSLRAIRAIRGFLSSIAFSLYPAQPSFYAQSMAKKPPAVEDEAAHPAAESNPPAAARRPSSLVDTRVIYCGDNLEQLAKLPDACVDLIYIDPPFNSNRNYEVFWGETSEKRSFDDRHASTQAYIDFMRPRCMRLARVLKKTGSFYYHCDWHASHYVKVMLDQIFGENNFQNEIIWKRTSAHSSANR
jgi:hypothetical protein